MFELLVEFNSLRLGGETYGRTDGHALFVTYFVYRLQMKLKVYNFIKHSLRFKHVRCNVGGDLQSFTSIRSLCRTVKCCRYLPLASGAQLESNFG